MTSPLRILHTHLSEAFSSSEQYCASLARHQAQLGHEVRVIIKDTAATTRWRADTGSAQVVVIPKWVPAFLETWVVSRMTKGFAPHIAHSHMGRADARMGAVAKSRKIPWATTVHHSWRPERMRRADAVICIADWQQPEIIKTGYKGQLRTVHNWLPAQKIAASADVEALRTSWRAGPQTMVFGSVGRLHAQKGMDILIKAFQQTFPDPETDVRLVIVGAGADQEKLQNLIGPDRRIHLVGFQPEVSPYYEAFDAYVSAARHEPFGLTILEAMSHGCQLVCTRTEGPSEYLQHASAKGQVIWAERGNTESLAAALNMAHTQGRGHITFDLTPFSLDRASSEILDIYTSILTK